MHHHNDPDEELARFIQWYRGLENEIYRLTSPLNPFHCPADRVYIHNSFSDDADVFISEDDSGNVVSEIFFPAKNGIRSWCVISQRPQDNHPLMLTASCCVLTMKILEGHNLLVVEPDGEQNEC